MMNREESGNTNQRLTQDQLKTQAEEMKAWLDKNLVSSSPRTHKKLRDAAEHFLQLFANTPEKVVAKAQKKRFYYALDKATDTLPQGGIRPHFVRCIKRAHRIVTEEYGSITA